MKKLIVLTLLLATLFACALPVSAAMPPTVEPQHENATSATVTLNIDALGNATVRICVCGKASLQKASVTTYLEKKVGTQWVRVDIDASGNAWQYSTTSRNFQKTYSANLNGSGQYRAVARFTLTGTTTESITSISNSSY